MTQGCPVSNHHPHPSTPSPPSLNTHLPWSEPSNLHPQWDVRVGQVPCPALRLESSAAWVEGILSELLLVLIPAQPLQMRSWTDDQRRQWVNQDPT